MERLKVLRLVEKHNLGGTTKLSTEWTQKLMADLEKNKLASYLDLANAVGQCVEERKTIVLALFIFLPYTLQGAR